MATLNVVEFTQPAASPGNVQIANVPPVADENVTISGTSAQSSAFNAATVAVRLVADSACYVAFGEDPTAAAGNIYLPAGAVEYFRVRPGHKVAGITA